MNNLYLNNNNLIDIFGKCQEDDPNFSRCTNFAWSVIENHRNLSTNSHNVRRHIEGIIERFRIENLDKHADYLEQLYQYLIKHPLCVNHYEVDIQWSLLDFFLTLAHSPIKNLKCDTEKFQINAIQLDESSEKDLSEIEECKNVLSEDFIPAIKFSDSDELSVSCFPI